ncbi:two-component system sensor histidine kinase MtrB [Micromonospora luteifusca]|uniref:Signal transduction histidine-protein kinase/phosphatase MprB n=1 Tax=Micromonospora luteifusca TaxID=709860 RepID=A0ABS2LLK9_9ACTN|nr:HAMP domain-containing sensor histidine kinase [Micromonospora luteifusca]MBM7489073.1 two-component system sensor histidine kinase MtrB [Micromonospora luteifusca]
MTRWRWAGARLLGLRVRLLLTFALLGVTTTAAVASGSYIQARTVILQQAQDAAVASLTDQLTKVYPLAQLPPTQGELDLLAQRLSDREGFAVVIYRDLRAQGSDSPELLTPELRQDVGDGRIAWQRVSFDGQPMLLIGTQLEIDRPDGTSRPSGLEVYSVRSLVPEQQSIDRLATLAWLTGGLSLILAVLLALLAARGVLRPVRDLGLAARRLGEGDLSTRLTVRGADELADVARTFNDTARTLERQVGELRRMESDARRFVADVSHELRTPLAAMTAVTDVLDEEADHLPRDAGRAARLVSQETQNLTQLVNDLIEVSRFDSGTARLALDDVDVAAAVTATLRIRGWVDRVRADLPPGVVARLDPRRLDVIVANLVGNAFRHGAEPVSVRLSADPDWVTIEVSDQGPGLDPEVLPHVFDRFYKADTARTRSEGSGLGLAISWENARLHRHGERRGSLVAGNGPGGGAVFTLRLPRDLTDDEGAR